MAIEQMKKFSQFIKNSEDYSLNKGIGFKVQGSASIQPTEKSVEENLYEDHNFGMLFMYDTVSRYVDLPDSFEKIWDSVDFLKVINPED